MKHILFGISILLLLSFTVKAQQIPETLVKDLYDAAKTTNIAEMSKKDLEKYFDKELAEAFWKVANGEDGIDFDILYNAQDTKITEFKIGKAAYPTSKPVTDKVDATVNVTFKNFGEDEIIEFIFGKSKSDWKILDIIYKDGSKLKEILASE